MKRISLRLLQLIFQINSSTNQVFLHYYFFDFKILGFVIFEQKDTFFKISLKILRINFFQNVKSVLSEIIYILRKQEETVRLAYVGT
jgi:hypothetical protein